MNSDKESFKKFNRDIVIAFISIIVIIVAFFSLIVGVKVSDTVSTSASGLMAANSRQLQININNYINKVEKTATLMFSDESYYLYDATDDSVDEYDKIQCEKKIMDRIVDLGLIDNYSDIGIVYPNEHTVGWISNTIGEHYNGRLYKTFSSYIPDSVSEDAWVCGKEGNFDRMYYVKRLNPNAILIVSFYNNELNYVFDYPEEMEGMSVYLTDEDNQVLYSSYKDAIGERLPDEIIQAFRFLKQFEDENTVAKYTIPAPAQMFQQMIVPVNYDNTRKYYETNEELINDIGIAYRNVIRQFYDAGCRNLQLDDCTWGAIVGDAAKQRYKSLGIDLEDVKADLLKVNNLALYDRPEDMVITSHICRGNYHSTYFSSGAYDSVADYVFAKENVDALFLEYDDERSGGFAPLSRVSEDKIVVLGLITTKSPVLEDKEKVIARIHEAAKYIPIERLCLSPQCGFASCEIGNKLTEDEQWAKLKLVREIAEEVWG